MPMRQLHMVGVGVVIGVALLILYSWGYFEKNSETFRYRLTINVRVDGKPYSASSVIEATQKRADCPWWGFSGSGAGGGCLPRFSAKGVAPMIRLSDGAVVFASLGGRVDYGRSLARLPWLLYVPNWRKATDTTKRNWPIIPLPKEIPRLEIPFSGRPLSKFHPMIWWVPPQELGPPKGYSLRHGAEITIDRRQIKPVSFSIEPTSDEVVEWLQPAPSWMAAYRGGPRISEDERKRRIRESSQQNFDHPARTDIETSKRNI